MKRSSTTVSPVVVFAVAGFLSVMLAAVSVFGVSHYLGQRSEFNDLVVETVGYIEESESPVVAMNTLLADPVSDESMARLESVIASLDDSEECLVRARAMLSSLDACADTIVEKETAAQVSKDIAGRQEMIEHGRAILYRLGTFQDAMDFLDEAWLLVDEGGEAASAAVRMVSASRNLDVAMEQTEEGLGCMVAARSCVANASFVCPAADLGANDAFLDNKANALRKQAEAISALQGLDSDRALECQRMYEVFEAAACGYVEEKADFYKPLIEAYSEAVSSSVSSYEAARTEVALSDRYLRDFWGQRNK